MKYYREINFNNTRFHCKKRLKNLLFIYNNKTGENASRPAQLDLFSSTEDETD
jgi:hypothetical protein